MSTEKEPFVKNAADENQVKNAAVKVKNQRDVELDDLRHVLSSAQGRRFMWRLLGHCGVFQSIFDQNDKVMAYYSGRQDVGHFIQSEIIGADEKLYLQMQTEKK